MSVMTCPECHRRLLSQASAKCNWCGHEIEDPAYKSQAEADRTAFFQHQAKRDAMGLAAIEAANISGLANFNPLSRGASGGNAFQQQKRRADAEIQARLAAERQAQQSAPRKVSNFGFPGEARSAEPQQQAQDVSPDTRPEPESSAQAESSRFNHLEL